MKLYQKIFLLVLLTTNFSYSQGNLFKDKKEQIRSLKIGYITTELDLSTDEATKFWPLFNAFETKQQEIRQQKLKNFLARLDKDVIDKMSEKEAQNLLTQMESTEEDLFQLRKKFVANLKLVLPAVKILKLKKAEEQFSKKLLQEYRRG